jgi:hypothetical protein
VEASVGKACLVALEIVACGRDVTELRVAGGARVERAPREHGGRLALVGERVEIAERLVATAGARPQLAAQQQQGTRQRIWGAVVEPLERLAIARQVEQRLDSDAQHLAVEKAARKPTLVVGQVVERRGCLVATAQV